MSRSLRWHQEDPNALWYAAGEALTGDLPPVSDGARGVRFIETTVASAASDAKWTPVPTAP